MRRSHTLRARTLVLALLLVSSGLVVGEATGQEAPTEIAVSNTSDEVNGDTSTVEALQSNPGDDGISLREAIAATNNDAGSYSIKFATGLAGTTIAVRFDTPPGDPLALTGGGVNIDGDIDGNGVPDVTVTSATSADSCEEKAPFAFIIASSGNRLHGLTVTGVRVAVALRSQPGQTQETYAGNEISGLIVRTCLGGITFMPNFSLSQCEVNPCVTDIRWVDTKITGNTIEARDSGIDVGPTGVGGDLIQYLTISKNKIDVWRRSGRDYGISVEAGMLPTTEGNRILDVVIADNTITGHPNGGIRVDSGGHGSLVERVVVSGNRVDIGPPTNPGMRSGVLVEAGDTEALDGVYASQNVIRDVEVSDNILSRGQGIRLQNGCCGAARNTMHDIRILRNRIDTAGPDGWPGLGGIWLEGAHGWFKGDGINTEPRATRDNHMYNISIVANRIRITSDNLKAGIWITGGGEMAKRNKITCVSLRRNRVIGTKRAVLVRDNLAGGQGNVVSLRRC